MSSPHVADLPKVEDWPHRPLFVTAASKEDEKVIVGISKGQPLPLGVPFEVQSSVFHGKLLVRLQNAPSDDAPGNASYFEGRQRVFQIAVQGRFPRPISMNNIYIGAQHHKRHKMVPPAWIEKIILALVRRGAPGAHMDMTSDHPHVKMNLAGSCQAVRMDQPGEEPDITDINLEENLLEKMDLLDPKQKINSKKATQRRRDLFSSPKEAAKHNYDPDYVYTFEVYDCHTNLGKNTMKIPIFGEFSLAKVLGQPMNWGMFDETTGERAAHMVFWHESVLNLENEADSKANR